MCKNPNVSAARRSLRPVEHRLLVLVLLCQSCIHTRGGPRISAFHQEIVLTRGLGHPDGDAIATTGLAFVCAPVSVHPRYVSTCAALMSPVGVQEVNNLARRACGHVACERRPGDGVVSVFKPSANTRQTHALHRRHAQLFLTFNAASRTVLVPALAYLWLAGLAVPFWHVVVGAVSYIYLKHTREVRRTSMRRTLLMRGPTPTFAHSSQMPQCCSAYLSATTSVCKHNLHLVIFALTPSPPRVHSPCSCPELLATTHYQPETSVRLVCLFSTRAETNGVCLS